jgi:PAS domain S-box-containing protein
MITPNLTILHVDDDADNRMSLGWVLRAEGFGLLQAANGAEALRLARRQPDIILLDVRLPDLDGFEVCRRLKADPATMAIPVLQLSGHYTSRDDRVHGLEGGADGFLAKPVEPRELLAHIWALIRVHRAERAALAAAAEWQTTFDAVGDGVCLLDHQGKVRRCNQAMARILDMEAEDVVDAQLVDLLWGLPPATAELPGPIEFTLRGRWYSIRVTPVVNERHDRTGSVQVWTEITGRRTAEEALRRREQEFHSLADHMPAMIARVDAGLHHLYVNPAVAAVTGIAAQAFQGKTARELGLPEEVVAFWEEHLRQAFAGGEELSAEFAYPTPHGPRYFQSRLVPERSEVGTVETVLCISHDVTELRQAVEERDRFFTQSLNLLCVASFDGFFRRLNPAWETTLGFTREELLARPIVDFVHPDDRESTLKEVAKLARGGTTTSFEIRCRCKDRSYKWLLWNATPFLDQRGFYATGHDITERKRLEEQFRQAQKMEAIGLLAGAPHRRRPCHGTAPRNPQSGRAGRRADPATLGLQPQADPAHPAPGPEQAGMRVGKDVSPPDR